MCQWIIPVQIFQTITEKYSNITVYLWTSSGWHLFRSRCWTWMLNNCTSDTNSIRPHSIVLYIYVFTNIWLNSIQNGSVLVTNLSMEISRIVLSTTFIQNIKPLVEVCECIHEGSFQNIGWLQVAVILWWLWYCVDDYLGLMTTTNRKKQRFPWFMSSYRELYYTQTYINNQVLTSWHFSTWVQMAAGLQSAKNSLVWSVAL